MQIITKQKPGFKPQLYKLMKSPSRRLERLSKIEGLHPLAQGALRGAAEAGKVCQGTDLPVLVFPLFPWATSTGNHQNILTRVRPLVQSHVVFLTVALL